MTQSQEARGGIENDAASPVVARSMEKKDESKDSASETAKGLMSLMTEHSS